MRQPLRRDRVNLKGMRPRLRRLVVDLVDGIAGLSKCNQDRFGEMRAFLIAFRDRIPPCAMSSGGMIDESGFDRTRDNQETIFRHLGSPYLLGFPCLSRSSCLRLA